MANKGSFALGLKMFEKENDEKIKKNVRKVLIASLGGCISTSPVDTGMFRLNWNVQAKTPDTTTIHEFGSAPGTEKAEQAKFDIGDKIYVSNALPYANRIESGWSKQAPGGVVKPVIRDIESKIKDGALD